MPKRLLVLLTPVQKTRIRGNVEGLFFETIKIFVHVMILQWGLSSGKLAVRRCEPAQNVNPQLTSLKQTRAYHQHIFCLEKIIGTGLEIHASPVDHTLDEHSFWWQQIS